MSMINSNKKPIPGSTGGQSNWTRLVDQAETYGAHIIRKFLQNIALTNTADVIVDLGAGSGRDLQIAHDIFPGAQRIAVEGHSEYSTHLSNKVDQIFSLNIENNRLPFADESVDIFMANQLLEHIKEIFWVVHEVTRSLRTGGYFIIGVPNIAALHNRLLLLLGQHPTQHKLYSAHVRPFSKNDTLKFMEICFPGGYELALFAGSQFYPLPASLARIICKLFPTMAFSIFFMFRKLKPYNTGFLDHPVQAQLETPFFLGQK